MIVEEKDLEDDTGKLKDKKFDLCGKEFQVGESYEKITTRRKSKLTVHTECIKTGL